MKIQEFLIFVQLHITKCFSLLLQQVWPWAPLSGGADQQLLRANQSDGRLWSQVKNLYFRAVSRNPRYTSYCNFFEICLTNFYLRQAGEVHGLLPAVPRWCRPKGSLSSLFRTLPRVCALGSSVHVPLNIIKSPILITFFTIKFLLCTSCY